MMNMSRMMSDSLQVGQLPCVTSLAFFSSNAARSHFGSRDRPDTPISGVSEGRRRWRGLLLFQPLIMF